MFPQKWCHHHSLCRVWKIVLLGRNWRDEMTVTCLFSSCSLTKSWHLAFCSLTSHLSPFQLLGGKSQSFERKSGLCAEGPAGLSYQRAKWGFWELFYSSPVSIIPYLEKLDLQSKSILWLNLCSNGKKPKNWSSFEGLDRRCNQFLNCEGGIVCVERTGGLLADFALALPVFLCNLWNSPFISLSHLLDTGETFPCWWHPCLAFSSCLLLCLYKQIMT